MGNAKYIGRVGALALALGIGTAVATTPWVALADPSSASDSSPSNATSDAGSTSTDNSKPAASVDDSDDDDASDASGVAETSDEEPATDTDALTTAETPDPTDEEPEDTEVVPDQEPSEPDQSVAGAEPSDNDDPAPTRPVTVRAPRSALVVSSIAAPADPPAPVEPAALVDTPVEPVSTPQASVTFSTASVVQAPAIPAPVAPAPLSGLVSGLLAWVGLGPSATGGPVSPAPPSPGLVLASAFVRRELVQAQAQQAPTTSLSTVQTSQTSGLLRGLLGGVLGVVFNRTPTTDYDPDENSQIAGGVVTGDLNAADADGDPLSFTVTDAPDKGSVVVNPDGTFVYTPSTSLAATGGTDVFKVRVADQGLHFHGLFGSHSTTATVVVTVEPTNTVIDTINVGGGPTDVMVSADGTKVYTANAFGDSVSVIDVATGTVTNIPVGDAPNGVALGVSANPNNPIVFVAVTNFNDDNYTVIDPATNAVIGTSPDIGDGPVGIAASPDGITGYVVNNLDNTLGVLDINGVTTIPVGQSPAYVAVSPNGNTAYVTNSFDDTVSVIDTVSRTVTATIAVGDGPRDVAFSPDGTRVYVTNGASDTVSVIDAATNTVTATVPVGDGPGGVAVSPDGARAYVTNQFDGTVSVVDTTTNAVVATIPVGLDPAFVAVSPDGTRLYVTNFGDDTVSVIRL